MEDISKDLLEFKEINTIVVTIADPLMEVEAILLQQMFSDYELEFSVSESGKIIYAETDMLEKVLVPLAQFGLSEDIVHIKHTKEYYSTKVHDGFSPKLH